MKITAAAARASRPAPTDWITGAAWMDEVAGADDAPGDARMVCVTFSPGARTRWHTHPRGQILHVIRGVGRVQKLGEAAHEIGPGDTVFIAAGEKHWHGAAPTRLMAHFAVQEVGPDGLTTQWLEPVSDADYGA
jgi:quercetin dioxygenase-like cupin family protein